MICNFKQNKINKQNKVFVWKDVISKTGTLMKLITKNVLVGYGPGT